MKNLLIIPLILITFTSASQPPVKGVEFYEALRAEDINVGFGKLVYLGSSDYFYGFTHTPVGVKRSHYKLNEILLENGLDVNEPDYNENTLADKVPNSDYYTIHDLCEAGEAEIKEKWYVENWYIGWYISDEVVMIAVGKVPSEEEHQNPQKMKTPTSPSTSPSPLVTGQSIGVNDLYRITSTTDMVLIKQYIENNSDFRYVGNPGIDEGGMDRYRFSDGANRLDVRIGSGVYDGQYMEVTDAIYYIYNKPDYQGFLRSLSTAGFKVREKDYHNDGTPFTSYNGTKTLKDQLRLVFIAKERDHYKISIL